MFVFALSVLSGWIGSLLVNYLSDVLPKTRKLVAHECPDCSGSLPVTFYLLLKPCPDCGARPSLRHVLVTILGPVLAGLMYFYPIENLGLFGGILWLTYSGVIVVIDLEYRLILHPVSIFGAVLALVFGSVRHGIGNTLLGGVGGFGIMLVFYLFGNLFVKVLSKRRGEEIDEVALGFGDVNLSGVIGLLLGWPGVIGGVFLAILLGGVVSGIFLFTQMIRKKYHAFQALPYGPFLVISLWLLFYYSQFVR
jgi:prepilin signal peptidase PulO-like enzyme (type II secretory pathway)